MNKVNINDFINNYVIDDKDIFLYDLSLKLKNYNNINLYDLLENKKLNDVLKSYIKNNIINISNINNIYKNRKLISLFDAFSDKYNYEIIYEKDEDLDLFKICMNEYSGVKRLSSDEILDLIIKAKETNDKNIIEEIIKANIFLVLSRVKRFYSKQSKYSEMLDSIQDGNYGLYIAYERFDLTKNIKFSTYAVWYIDNEISKGLQNKMNKFSYSKYFMACYKKYKIFVDEYYKMYGEKPTLKKIVKTMNINENLAELLIIYEENNILSLDYDYFFDDRSDYYEITPLDYNLEEEFEKKYLKEELKKIIQESNLTVREKEIVNKILELESDESLASIADYFNISRQRVHDIYSKILYKLKNNDKIKKLYYVDYNFNNRK